MEGEGIAVVRGKCCWCERRYRASKSRIHPFNARHCRCVRFFKSSGPALARRHPTGPTSSDIDVFLILTRATGSFFLSFSSIFFIFYSHLGKTGINRAKCTLTRGLSIASGPQKHVETSNDSSVHGTKIRLRSEDTEYRHELG